MANEKGRRLRPLNKLVKKTTKKPTKKPTKKTTKKPTKPKAQPKAQPQQPTKPEQPPTNKKPIIYKPHRGRPRTTSPHPRDVIALGKELVKWASEPTTELRCRFCQWYSLVKGLTKRQFDELTKRAEFAVYHEQARTLLGQKYVDGSVPQSIAHRFLRIYHPDLRDEEDQTARFNSELKRGENREQVDNLLTVVRGRMDKALITDQPIDIQPMPVNPPDSDHNTNNVNNIDNSKG